MLLALDMGANHGHMTRPLHINRGTGRAWHQRWLALTPKLERIEAEGGSDHVLTTVIVERLSDHPRSGAPATFTAEQMVQMVAVAGEDLADSGRPLSHWTPREVAEEGRKRGMVEATSTRRVGRFFQAGRLTAASGGGLAQRQAGGPRGVCRPSGGGV